MRAASLLIRKEDEERYVRNYGDGSGSERRIAGDSEENPRQIRVSRGAASRATTDKARESPTSSADESTDRAHRHRLGSAIVWRGRPRHQALPSQIAVGFSLIPVVGTGSRP